MRRILILALVLLMGLLTVACGTEQSETQKVAFVLDWVPNTNHTGIYVAEAKGYFEEVGIELEIIQPPEDGALGAVATGQAQFGIDFQESLGIALTAEHPLPVTAIAAVIDHNTSGLISLAESNINGFADLEGKTYATWNSPSELAVLEKVMSDAGADFSKLNLIPNSGTDAISLMQSGIDVVWVYEGVDVMMAQLQDLDYRFHRFTQQSPVLDFYTPVIVANNQVLEENPELAKAFLEAAARGYEYAIENPVESAEILVEAVPELSLEFVTRGQEFLVNEYKAEKPFWGTIDEARWSEFYIWMYEAGLIPKELASQGFTNEFLPDNS